MALRVAVPVQTELGLADNPYSDPVPAPGESLRPFPSDGLVPSPVEWAAVYLLAVYFNNALYAFAGHREEFDG